MLKYLPDEFNGLDGEPVGQHVHDRGGEDPRENEPGDRRGPRGERREPHGDLQLGQLQRVHLPVPRQKRNVQRTYRAETRTRRFFLTILSSAGRNAPEDGRDAHRPHQLQGISQLLANADQRISRLSLFANTEAREYRVEQFLGRYRAGQLAELPRGSVQLVGCDDDVAFVDFFNKTS